MFILIVYYVPLYDCKIYLILLGNWFLLFLAILNSTVDLRIYFGVHRDISIEIYFFKS